MKREIPFFALLIGLTLVSLKSYCQTDKIISDSKEFDYLIGLEYEDERELNGLAFSGRSSMIKDEVETATTIFVKDDYQIITAEKVSTSSRTNQKKYLIQDVLIFKGFYSICGGCLVSKNSNIEIDSYHPVKMKKRDSIIFAFQRDRITGIFSQVDPKSYSWNMNADLLDKY